MSVPENMPRHLHDLLLEWARKHAREPAGALVRDWGDQSDLGDVLKAVGRQACGTLEKLEVEWLIERLHDFAWSIEDELDRRERDALARGVDVPAGPTEVERKTYGRVTYIRELRKCNKPSCRCSRKGGKLHGPYWIAYWYDGKRRRTEYVGKTLSGLDERERVVAEAQDKARTKKKSPPAPRKRRKGTAHSNARP